MNNVNDVLIFLRISFQQPFQSICFEMAVERKLNQLFSIVQKIGI